VRLTPLSPAALPRALALSSLIGWNQTLADWQVSLSLGAVLLAVGFSGLVGIFFGYYPARRASQMLPIAALRHE